MRLGRYIGPQVAATIRPANLPGPKRGARGPARGGPTKLSRGTAADGAGERGRIVDAGRAARRDTAGRRRRARSARARCRGGKNGGARAAEDVAVEEQRRTSTRGVVRGHIYRSAGAADVMPKRARRAETSEAARKLGRAPASGGSKLIVSSDRGRARGWRRDGAAMRQRFGGNAAVFAGPFCIGRSHVVY